MVSGLENGNGNGSLFRPHFFIALHYYYTGFAAAWLPSSCALPPSSFVSWSHIVAYLKSQFVWRPRSHPVAVWMPGLSPIPSIFPPPIFLFCLICAFNPQCHSRSPLSVTCYRLVHKKNYTNKPKKESWSTAPTMRYPALTGRNCLAYLKIK